MEDEVKEHPIDSKNLDYYCQQILAESWSQSKDALAHIVSLYTKQIPERQSFRPLIISTFLEALKLWFLNISKYPII